MNIELLNSKEKLWFVDFLEANQDFVCEYGNIPPFWQQLNDDGYVERVSVRPGYVNLRPTHKLKEAIEEWDVETLKHEVETENAVYMRLGDGNDFGVI